MTADDPVPLRSAAAVDREDDLAKVWDRVAAGRAAIVRQEAVVMELRERRENVHLALSVLDALKRVQRLWEEDYDYLLRKLNVPRF